jgi:hypothetical protein
MLPKTSSFLPPGWMIKITTQPGQEELALDDNYFKSLPHGHSREMLAWLAAQALLLEFALSVFLLRCH